MMIYATGTAQKRWKELVDRGSVRNDRLISWPISTTFKGRPVVVAAQEQFDEGFRTSHHTAPFNINPPVDWGANPFSSKEWRNRLMWMQPLDLYHLAYEASRDIIWLDRATSLFLDWILYHKYESHLSSAAWVDMNVGIRAAKLALLVDYAVSGLWTPNASEADLLVWAIDTHIDRLRRPEELSEGNHGFFQLHGLQILSSICWNNPSSGSAEEYVNQHQRRILRNQFSEEGVHKEHSAKYHWWMVRTMRHLINSGWYGVEAVSWVEGVLERAEEIKHWMTSPGGTPVLTGDSKERRPLQQESTQSEAPDYRSNRYRFRWLPDSGYAVCKTDDALLFLNAAYHSKAHRHSDDLHFDLHDFSKAILIDGGSFSNDPGLGRSYLVGTSAHNTVQTDMENYPFKGEEAYGSALLSAECLDYGVRINASVRHRAMAVTHRRRIDYIPGSGLTCSDDMRADKERVFRQWFHFDPRWQVGHVGSNSMTLDDGQTEIRLSCINSIRMEVFRGQENPLQGWRLQGGRLVPSVSVSFVGNGLAVNLTTRIEYGNTLHPTLGKLQASFLRSGNV